MDKPISNKAVKSREELQERKKIKKRGFFFPSEGVTIKAENLEEATKKLKALKSKKS